MLNILVRILTACFEKTCLEKYCGTGYGIIKNDKEFLSNAVIYYELFLILHLEISCAINYAKMFNKYE